MCVGGVGPPSRLLCGVVVSYASGGDLPPFRGLSVKCLHQGVTNKGVLSHSACVPSLQALLPGCPHCLKWVADLRTTSPAGLTPPAPALPRSLGSPGRQAVVSGIAPSLLPKSSGGWGGVGSPPRLVGSEEGQGRMASHRPTPAALLRNSSGRLSFRPVLPFSGQGSRWGTVGGSLGARPTQPGDLGGGNSFFKGKEATCSRDTLTLQLIQQGHLCLCPGPWGWRPCGSGAPRGLVSMAAGPQVLGEPLEPKVGQVLGRGQETGAELAPPGERGQTPGPHHGE